MPESVAEVEDIVVNSAFTGLLEEDSNKQTRQFQADIIQSG